MTIYESQLTGEDREFLPPRRRIITLERSSCGSMACLVQSWERRGKDNAMTPNGKDEAAANRSL